MISRSVGFRGRVPIKRLRPIAIASVFLDVAGIQISQCNVANQRDGGRSGEEANLCEATQWAEYRNNRRDSGYAFEDHHKNPLCQTNGIRGSVIHLDDGLRQWQRWTEGRTAVPAKDESIIGRGIASRAAPCGDEIRGRIVHQRGILRAANRYCCKQGISLKPTRINWGWIGPRSFHRRMPWNGDCAKVAAYSYCSVARVIGNPLPRVCWIHISWLSVADDVGVNEVSQR
jgi:hypothetical protein